MFTSGEPITNSKISAFDLHAGLLYTYEDEMKTFYAGGSVYHLTNPKNYFLGHNAVYETIPKRYNANAGANVSFGEFRLAASLLYMKQADMDELIMGSAVGIPLPLENSFLYVGSWYRLNESLIPTINLQWQNLNIGFSYDTYVGNKAVTKPRSMEFSITYRANPYRDYRTSCFAF